MVEGKGRPCARKRWKPCMREACKWVRPCGLPSLGEEPSQQEKSGPVLAGLGLLKGALELGPN